MSRVVAVPFRGLLGALALIALLAPPGGPAPRSLAGQFLVASERLENSPFARTVVYVVRHDADGAYGLVINRPGPELPLAPLLSQLGLDDRGVTGRIRTHGGGPVEVGRWAVLHSGEYAVTGTERLAPDVALTSEPAVLADIAHGRRGSVDHGARRPRHPLRRRLRHQVGARHRPPPPVHLAVSRWGRGRWRSRC